MCFGGGGGSQPQATVTTPAVPVSEITAGHPTVTVSPPKADPPPASPTSNKTSSAPAASQIAGNTGLNPLGM